MTKLKGIITLFVLTIFSTGIFANSITEDTKNEMRKEIAFFLNDVDVRAYDIEEITVNITFLVTRDNEIIVLSTNESQFDSLFKGRLNYKQFKTIDTDKNKVYSVDVTLKAEA